MQLYGGLSAEAWPGIVATPDWGKLRFRPVTRVPLHDRLPGAPAAALALLERLLRLDPGEEEHAGLCSTCALNGGPFTVNTYMHCSVRPAHGQHSDCAAPQVGRRKWI